MAAFLSNHKVKKCRKKNVIKKMVDYLNNHKPKTKVMKEMVIEKDGWEYHLIKVIHRPKIFKPCALGYKGYVISSVKKCKK